MNIQILSSRLQSVVKYIPQGYRLADIGSDHAYLPCHVVQKGLVPFAIAGEVVEGPYQSARKQVQTAGLSEQISVRLGNGLDVLEIGEVDCITIAGMGGSLIASILERGVEKLDGVKRLILQPNVGAIAIRKWLLEHQWQLINEEILEEDGKIYEILVAEKGDPYSAYGENLEIELLVGPFLQKEQNEAFAKKWMNEKTNWQRIITQLEQADPSEQNLMKKQELQAKINLIEEVLQS
jgi:tRNA (adenine22-N1)-methyltransferase